MTPLITVLTVFAPDLLCQPLGPVQAWPVLSALAKDHRVLTKSAPLFQWLLVVANVHNKLFRMPYFTPTNVDGILNVQCQATTNALLNLLPPSHPSVPQAIHKPASAQASNKLQFIAELLLKVIPYPKAEAPKTPSTCWPFQFPNLLHVWWF